MDADERCAILRALLLQVPREPLVEALRRCGRGEWAGASASDTANRFASFLLALPERGTESAAERRLATVVEVHQRNASVPRFQGFQDRGTRRA